ncbi:hypothetical protein [Sebaldella sp. S0638]|uniref:hypothetical protein n=1 Tax=Sebaldella sp. S0638 TaxID=2957809 RepID=UPI0020A0412A|nr:hypothetical protein [Sebaldella sp. S0638]MCP1224689.1 hypothetical protein [Sebaldella sp. S0638]
MRIKIDKITFADFLIAKMSTDKINLIASFLIVYAYVMMKLRYNLMMSMAVQVTVAILIGIAVTALIYGLLYFLKFRKLKGENPGVQGKFDKDSVKEFNIFGTQKKFKMQPYSKFNKKYENKYTFFMRFDGMKLLFLPKKYLTEEEIDYIRRKIS